MRRTKAEAEQTREDILNAATEMFYENGVSKTTLDDIAKAANVTRGAIYWHFKNKLEIFDALHERLHRPLADQIMADMTNDHPEPLAQLQELATKLLIDIQEDPQRRKILTVFLTRCEYAGELETCKARYCSQKKESLGLFSNYFEKAKRMGKLPQEADAELLSLSVSCFMKGLLIEYLDNFETFDMKEKAPAMMALFFKSFK